MEDFLRKGLNGDIHFIDLEGTKRIVKTFYFLEQNKIYNPISQPGGTDYAHHINTGISPTALAYAMYGVVHII